VLPGKSLLSSQGAVDSPFELEYADEDTLMVYASPVENNSPIPVAVPTPSVTPQDLDAENIHPVPRVALRLIMDAEDEGNGYVEPSDRVLDELRVLCERDAEEVIPETHHDRMMALQSEDMEVGPLRRCGDLVEDYVQEVHSFCHQAAHRGQKHDPTCGMHRLPGSKSEQHIWRSSYGRNPIGPLVDIPLGVV
jgi:hypothetical protein